MMDNRTSSADKLRNAARGQAVTRREPESFPQMLNAYKSQIAAALPKHISGDRMARVALTCFRQNPKLAECTPQSVFASIIIGAQLGLEPGILGQAYLVPYGKECQFIPGWQGMCDLVNRSGRASCWTGAVFKGDEFKYELGSSPGIHHVPSGDDDRPENLTHTYSVGRVRGSEYPVIEVWPVLKITRHRDRYNKVGKRHYSFENFEMYGRKVPLLQVFKYMPKSVELATALRLDHAGDGGQLLSLQDAIDGTFLPPAAAALEHGGADSKETPAADAPSATDAIAYLKSAQTTEELKSTWASVVDRYKDAGASIPVDVEAMHNDRRETLTQAEAKRK